MVRSPKISSESQHIPAREPQPGYQLIAGAPQNPLSYLEFGLLTLAAGHPPFTWETREREVAFHLLGGTCEVTVSGGAGALAGTLGPRRDVFGGPPAALFAPAGSRVGLSALHDGARLAVLSVPPAGDRPPSLISSMQVVTRAVGKDSWTRRVTSVVDQRVSSRLLAGETLHAAGPWSSYPPHKHDANLPGKEVPWKRCITILSSRGRASASRWSTRRRATRIRSSECIACGMATPWSFREATIRWSRPAGTRWRTCGPSPGSASTTAPGPPIPPTSGSSPEPPRGDAANHEALRERVGQQHRAHGDDRASHERTVVDVPVGIFEQRDPDGQRPQPLRVDDDHRPEEVVPGAQEQGHGDGGQRGFDQRRDDRGHDAHLAGSVDPGSVDQIHGDALD